MADPRRLRRAFWWTFLVCFAVYALLIVTGAMLLRSDWYSFFQVIANIWLVCSVLALGGLLGWRGVVRIQTAGTKVCPQCAERVQSEARACRFCGQSLA